MLAGSERSSGTKLPIVSDAGSPVLSDRGSISPVPNMTSRHWLMSVCSCCELNICAVPLPEPAFRSVMLGKEQSKSSSKYPPIRCFLRLWKTLIFSSKFGSSKYLKIE